MQLQPLPCIEKNSTYEQTTAPPTKSYPLRVHLRGKPGNPPQSVCGAPDGQLEPLISIQNTTPISFDNIAGQKQLNNVTLCFAGLHT